jgi:hypothetical protein
VELLVKFDQKYLYPHESTYFYIAIWKYVLLRIIIKTTRNPHKRVKICHNILNNHLQDHHKNKNVKKEEEAKGVYIVGNTWSHLGHLKGGQIIIHSI